MFLSLAIVVLAIGGAIYQSVSVRREAARFPPPGQLIDIGGRRLHLICLGDGRPVVIFEPSGFSNALSAGAARAEIGSNTRVHRPDGRDERTPLPPGLAFVARDPATLDRDRRELAQALARRSSRGSWRIVPGSDHLIASSQPHAVAAVVMEMVAQIRNAMQIER